MVNRKTIVMEILAHKISSIVIGVIVVSLFGIPILTNLAITGILTIITLLKDYYLRKYFYSRHEYRKRSKNL